MELGRTEIKDLGEFKLIEQLTEDFSVIHPSTIKGIGDDAAVIDIGKEALVITTDLLLEGVHFDLMYFPLKHLGYKAIIVNLSDVYAMNAIPQQVTVSIGVSNRFSIEALEELYSGIKLACDFYKVDLIGGDTSASQKGLCISITAIGRQAKEKIVYRSGANCGDFIFVTGNLGAAYLGLQLLEREKQIFLSDPKIQPQLNEHKEIIAKFLKPEAKQETIHLFKQLNIVPTSMMDLSDGLSSDLMHICKQSSKGAIIEETSVPMDHEAQLLALEFKLDPITCALNGGEDYELLFTVNKKDAEQLRYLPGFYYIGEIADPEKGIHLKTASGKLVQLLAQGWKHF